MAGALTDTLANLHGIQDGGLFVAQLGSLKLGCMRQWAFLFSAFFGPTAPASALWTLGASTRRRRIQSAPSARVARCGLRSPRVSAATFLSAALCSGFLSVASATRGA